MDVTCNNCGNDINRKPSHANRSSVNFCCRGCKNEYTVKQTIEDYSRRVGTDNLRDWLISKYITEKKTIRQLMVLFDTKSNRTVIKLLDHFNIQKRYGSDAIKTQWIDNEYRRKEASKLAKEKLNSKVNRERLHTVMKTDEYRLKQRISKTGTKNGMYGITGEINARWDPNRTNEIRVKERKSFKNSRWRKLVFERDKYRCNKCDQVGRRLVAHHLNSYDIHTNDRYLVGNGITLCEECHKEFHQQYGYGRNTSKQFNKFKLEDA